MRFKSETLNRQEGFELEIQESFSGFSFLAAKKNAVQVGDVEPTGSRRR